MSEAEGITPESIPPSGFEPQIGDPPIGRPEVFWGWHDVGMFIFITCIALGAGMLAALGIRHALHLSESRMAIVAVIAQFGAYGIAFACLKLMFSAEYDEPLARSLRWLPVSINPLMLAGIGLAQAMGIALVGLALRVPHTDTPMNQLMSDGPTAVVIAVVGVTLAPLSEELAFRGFLQPLVIRTLGIVPGILLTSAIFGALHLSQYGFTWQSFVLISMAGLGFGIMRQVTGSTRASAFMHAGYNSVLFILFFIGKGQQH